MNSNISAFYIHITLQKILDIFNMKWRNILDKLLFWVTGTDCSQGFFFLTFQTWGKIYGFVCIKFSKCLLLQEASWNHINEVKKKYQFCWLYIATDCLFAKSKFITDLFIAIYWFFWDILSDLVLIFLVTLNNKA